VVVGKVKLFWFFSLGIERWQKPNVLDRVVAFQLAYNGQVLPKAGSFSTKVQSKDEC